MSKGILQISLTSESRGLLMSFSKYDVVKCDHITVQFGIKDDSDLMKTLTMGTSISILVESVASNDRIQAARCNVPSVNCFPEGKIVHITISHIEGAKPVESNSMLVDPVSEEKLSMRLLLEGVLEFKPFN
jgi:hypothetical protein